MNIIDRNIQSISLEAKEEEEGGGGGNTVEKTTVSQEPRSSRLTNENQFLRLSKIKENKSGGSVKKER